MLRSKILRAASLRNMRVSSPGGGGGGGDSLLLDTYTGASVAYSVRKLRTAYSGAALRAFRFSDDAEQDIGFIGNDLDTAALASFIGGSTGLVSIWYDQSGNANDAVAIGSIKPFIYTGGSTITFNSKPAIQAASSQYLDLTTPLAITTGQTGSYWMIYNKNTTAGNAVLLTSGSSYMWYDDGTTQYVTSSRTITIGSAFNVDTQYLYNCIQDYDNLTTIYSNGTSLGSHSGSAGGNAGMSYIPAVSFRSSTLLLQEFIFYPNNQSSNRTSIDSNINTYYAIY